jgi:hypothetical protein
MNQSAIANAVPGHNHRLDSPGVFRCDPLTATIRQGERPARRNAVWALSRLIKARCETPSGSGIRRKYCSALLVALRDSDPSIRQSAWHGIGTSRVIRPDETKGLSAYECRLWQDAVQSLSKTLLSADGRTYSGLVLKDTAEEVTIQQAPRRPDHSGSRSR